MRSHEKRWHDISNISDSRFLFSQTRSLPNRSVDLEKALLKWCHHHILKSERCKFFLVEKLTFPTVVDFRLVFLFSVACLRMSSLTGLDSYYGCSMFSTTFLDVNKKSPPPILNFSYERLAIADKHMKKSALSEVNFFIFEIEV